MVDFVITPANVLPGSDASIKHGSLAGEAITQGRAVYLADATKKWMLADSNSATAEARRATGMSLNSASLNQPLSVQQGGTYGAGTTLTPGVAVYLSDTPGGICPVADVGTGEYVEIIGIAISESQMTLQFSFPNVAL